MKDFQTTLIRIPVDLHRKLKIHVASECVTMSSVLADLLIEYLKDK